MTTSGEVAALLGARLVHDHGGSRSIELADVTADSREHTIGALFCCVPGAVHDGHDHAPDAVAAGAVALLCDHELDLDAPQLVVDDVRAAMGPAAALVHGQPSTALDVVGVTGTNGKTTVVSMIESILTAAGRHPRTIGTLTGERTTPEAPQLQRTLARFRDEGADAVAMEVSSHALAQHRVDAVEFAVGVFTNLGTDHLDFHGTQESYFAAKARLFEDGRSRTAVVNIGDIHGRLLRDASAGPVVAVDPAGAGELRVTDEGMGFVWRDVSIELPMFGVHNVTNALLAAEACMVLGATPDEVATGLATLERVPGRFETFDAGDGSTVVVDYAHTPDALEAALTASRDLARGRGRVTVVFGCGGDRDPSKRPMMGRVATELADRTILTSDNPRSEDPTAILEQIAAGARGPVEIIADRAEAIGAAVSSLGTHDVVLVAGKGHEQGQQFATTTVAFDDRDQVRTALSNEADR